MSMEPPFAATVPGMLAFLHNDFGALSQLFDAAGAHSFNDINSRSAALARGLIAAGMPKGARIGIILPNGADYIEALFGITRAGGHAVLISTLARPNELSHMIRHADVDLVIATDHYLSRDYVADLEEALPSLTRGADADALRLPEAPFLRGVWMWGGQTPAWSRGNRVALERLGKEIDDDFLRAVEAEITPSDPAVLIYTSGSTSLPKAVVHSHGNVTRQGWRMSRYMSFLPGDRLMTTQPFFWVGGLCTSLLAASLSGAAVVCPEPPNIEGMRTAMDEFGVTHASLWPPQMNALISSPGFGSISERLKPALAQQLALFGLAAPERTPNCLGMTETFGPHSMELPGTRLPDGRELAFGRAVGGIDRKIIDPATGDELPHGEAGELWVRGGTLMTGFHRKERHETFDRDGFYNTGDRCSLSVDGYLFFVGRDGDMIKTSGVNVAPVEVEEALMKEHEIAEAIVVGLPDPTLGQLLVAAVALHEGAAIDEISLRGRLRARLSSYKIPKRVFILNAADIPRTAGGKVFKPALKATLSNLMEDVGNTALVD